MSCISSNGASTSACRTRHATGFESESSQYAKLVYAQSVPSRTIYLRQLSSLTASCVGPQSQRRNQSTKVPRYSMFTHIGRASRRAPTVINNCKNQIFPANFFFSLSHGKFRFNKVLRDMEVDSYSKGLSRLAKILDSNDRFMMFRQFRYVQARLLLRKQDQLHILSQRLEVMDRCKEIESHGTSRCEEKGNEGEEASEKLLTTIEVTFHQYGKVKHA